MYRIALVNMPFASVALPSIALTQMRARVERELSGEAEADVFYWNHDFARLLGVELYGMVADSVEAVTSGLGDWFFRPLAFPELDDNADAYLARHFADRRREIDAVREPLLAAREKAGAVLDELIDRHRLDRYALVGLTSMFSQNVACFALARRLKERHPEIVTVMGGANCETPMGEVIARNVGAVDFVASGPALESFPELARRLVAGDEDGCHRIRGVFSRRRLAESGERSLKEVGSELDIDVEVPLDFDGFLASFENLSTEGRVQPILPFETSRGCWWGERSHCTFCGLNGLTMKYRSMAPEKALELLDDLFERYGDKVRRFQSVDNILPREYLTEVLPRLEPPAGAEIFYEVKADLKDHEMATLAQAGVTQIQPGIEALATSTLKLMRKGTTSFQNLRFLKACLAYGIEPHWNLLVGFPGEEEEVYKKYFADLPMLVHLPPPSGVYPVRFDRYSPYYTQASEYGLELRTADFYRMVYPFDEEDLEQMAYYFADQNYNAPYLMRTAKWLGKLRQRVEYWHARTSRRDRGLAPRLEYETRGGERLVIDTRSGMQIEHRIAPAELAVLELLAKPMKPARMIRQLETSEAELKRLLARLKGRGLLFQDRDLYMSLVIEPEAEASLRWPQVAGRGEAARGGAGLPAS